MASSASSPPPSSHRPTIALIGPPNAGKSTVFNRLTGASQRVGNFPGVTVDRMEGVCRLEGDSLTVIDLPGLYSLAPQEIDGGLDHAVAREFLTSGSAELILNVVDATRLEQSLYLTVQLLERGLPMVVALNMTDAAEEQGLETDVAALSQRLGCPVVPLAAARGRGIDDLKRLLCAWSQDPTTPRVRNPASDPPPVPYMPVVEEAIAALLPHLEGYPDAGCPCPQRFLAIALLEGDSSLPANLPAPVTAVVEAQRRLIEETEGEEADSLIADARFETAHSLCAACQKRDPHTRAQALSDRLDSLALHPMLGIPVFLLVMYGLFTFTISFGGAFIDAFDIAAGALLVDGFGTLLTGVLGAPDWLRVLLADGLGGGIQVVATFIPVVGTLFLALTVLEDSGYMARAAFVMDRVMSRLGLPGKAVVPLIVGFGCNVPSVMATRVLERPRDRAITIAMAPFMSCGARLAVYALFVAAFFPQGGQNVVMGLYLVGILMAVLTALVLRRTLLAGDSAPFMMELPSYRLPRLRDVLLHTWTRLKLFLVEAGKVIAVVVMVLTLLGALGPDGRFDHDGDEGSILAGISRAVTPAFAPMGVEEENWPAVVGIVTGLFAKEAVVGTLDTLYTAEAEAAAEARAAAAGQTAAPGADPGPGEVVLTGLSDALATIPENLGGLWTLLADPLDLGSLEDPGIGDTSATSPTLTALAAGFDGTLGAMAYLLFILLYVPCVAVLGAIRREIGWRWTIFVTLWTTGIAYGVATLVYQLGTLPQHPTQSLAWAAGIGCSAALTIGGLALAGRRARPDLGPLARESRA